MKTCSVCHSEVTGNALFNGKVVSFGEIPDGASLTCLKCARLAMSAHVAKVCADDPHFLDQTVKVIVFCFAAVGTGLGWLFDHPFIGMTIGGFFGFAIGLMVNLKGKGLA